MSEFRESFSRPTEEFREFFLNHTEESRDFLHMRIWTNLAIFYDDRLTNFAISSHGQLTNFVLFSPSIKWRNLRFFQWLIIKFRDSLSDWLANFAVSSCDRLTKFMFFPRVSDRKFWWFFFPRPADRISRYFPAIYRRFFFLATDRGISEFLSTTDWRILLLFWPPTKKEKNWQGTSKSTIMNDRRVR